MQIITLFCVFVANVLASPFAQPQSGEDTTWKPNPGTVATCDTKSDKVLGLYVGPQMKDILNKACAAMMPDCAFPVGHPDKFCITTVDFQLDGNKNSTQNANVQDGGGAKLPTWDVKLAVYPPQQPKNPAGIFWRVTDCYGYFAYLLTNWVNKGGCHFEAGFGLGNITAGTGNSLEGTIFEVTVVEAS